MHRLSRIIASTAAAVLAVALVPATPALAAPASPAQASLVTAVDTGPGLPNEVPSASTPWVGDNSAVRTFVQVGNTMIAGGRFDDISNPGGSPTFTRTHLVAFDATTGAVRTGFNPVLNGDVEALIPGPTAGTFYVAGSFTTVNGMNRSHVALLNASNGSLVTSFTPAATNGVVNTIALSGGRLFLGGTFKRAGGVDHGGFATLDPTTGAIDPYLSLDVAENHNTDPAGARGAIGVRKLAITPAGDRMIAIGNFRTVEGLDRDQIVMVSLQPGGAVVTPDWATQRYTPLCFSWAFDSYMRDLAMSPDGSYFVVGSTGGHNDGTLCDTASRFETYASGTSLQPTWADYAGGDTIWGIGITESAVYVGGHQRWMNNTYGSDFANQGAVPRPGMAALDPLTGVPLDWNPGRNPRGVSAFTMFPTDDGIWMGSDTIWVGNRQFRRPRIAFFPYAGGRPTASTDLGSLPGDVYVAGAQQDSGILYRVNAGGGQVQAIDGGPDWMADGGADSPFRTSGSNTGGWDADRTLDNTVPGTTPATIFDTERWDPGEAPEMNWDFPVPAGQEIQVRVYLANRCDCTASPGSRVFDVALDGTTVVDDIDLSGEVGHDVGTMRAFDITSDGNVDLDFGHVVENTLVNGIEIVTQESLQPAPHGVLYRVNAGGGRVPSADAGPDWAADTGGFRTGAGNPAGWDSNRTVDGTVPANTPRSIFDTELWGPDAGNEIRWNFPVASGEEITVRLFFANRCGCTENPGQRAFDVFLDGSNVLNDFDMSGTVGHNVGTMREFDITSDGNVDIDLGHVVENPLINGIEIVRQGTTPGGLTSVRASTFDGNDAAAVRTVNTPGFNWAAVRGAVMIGNRLFYGNADGFLYRRSFDGEDFGPAVQINPYNDPKWDNVDSGSGGTFNGRVPDFYGRLDRVTSMFYADGRLFYTLDGDGNLYWQLFSADSGIVDPVLHSRTGSFDWSRAQGAFVADGDLYVASSQDGSLSRIAMSGGFPDGPATVVDSPATGGIAWNGRAVFLSTFAPQLPNQAPTAAFGETCDFLDCDFNASASDDSDGTIESYAWDFGDGDTSSAGPNVSHGYDAAGTYLVELTVTDDDNDSTTTSHEVVVEEAPNQPPVAAFTQSCLQLSCEFDGTDSVDPDGTIESYAWAFGDGGTSTEATPDHTFPADDTYDVVLTVTDDDGETDSVTIQVTVSEAADISFVGQESAMRNLVNHTLPVPAGTQPGDRLLLVMSFNRTGPTVDNPTGVGTWTSHDNDVVKTMRSRVWSIVAGPGVAGQSVTVHVSARTKASMILTSYRGSSQTADPVVASAVDTVNRANRTTPTVTAPAGALAVSYWADKSADTTSWTAPAGVTVRAQTFGTLAGHISALLADSDGPVPSGPYGGLVATSNTPSPMATMYTIVLRP